MVSKSGKNSALLNSFYVLAELGYLLIARLLVSAILASLGF